MAFKISAETTSPLFMATLGGMRAQQSKRALHATCLVEAREEVKPASHFHKLNKGSQNDFISISRACEFTLPGKRVSADVLSILRWAEHPGCSRSWEPCKNQGLESKNLRKEM
jgi:hypothetical protein